MSLDPGFTTAESLRIFSPSQRLARMLDFEAALAGACAAVGILPATAADAIYAACERCARETTAQDTAAEELFAAGWEAGSPVILLVARLRELAGEAAPWVHHGATTQDVVDTGLVLQIREGLRALARCQLATGEILAGLADQHRATLMLGRTLMQPAAPIPFGLKAAGWLDSWTRDLERSRRLDARLPLQLGGPVGDLALFGEHGLAVAEELGGHLGLAVPAMPWHAARDRIAEVAAALALAARSVAKVAGDLILLAQGEVAEISMRGGGSSSMAGKRNPIDAVRATAAARFAAGQAALLIGAGPAEHERPAGAWHLEWAAVPALFHGALAAAEALLRGLESLEIHEERMRAHLDLLASGAPATEPEGRMADRLIDRVLRDWKELQDGDP